MTGMRLATAYKMVNDDLHRRLAKRREALQREIDDLEKEARQLIMEETMIRIAMGVDGDEAVRLAKEALQASPQREGDRPVSPPDGREREPK